MTEKRYSYFKSSITGLYVISDEKLRETFSGIDDEYNCNRIVRILNTKEKENRQLKKDLKKKFVPFAKADGDYTTVDTEEFIKILNENEQLKQEKEELLDKLLECQKALSTKKIREEPHWHNYRNNEGYTAKVDLDMRFYGDKDD